MFVSYLFGRFGCFIGLAALRQSRAFGLGWPLIAVRTTT